MCQRTEHNSMSVPVMWKNRSLLNLSPANPRALLSITSVIKMTIQQRITSLFDDAPEKDEIKQRSKSPSLVPTELTNFPPGTLLFFPVSWLFLVPLSADDCRISWVHHPLYTYKGWGKRPQRQNGGAKRRRRTRRSRRRRIRGRQHAMAWCEWPFKKTWMVDQSDQPRVQIDRA